MSSWVTSFLEQYLHIIKRVMRLFYYFDKILLDTGVIISYILYGMKDETYIIGLTRGKVTLVREVDLKYVSNFKWFALKAAYSFYAARTIRVSGKRTTQLMHRVIMGCTNGQQIHHKNGNSLDNRRDNLEICSQSENLYYRVRGN
jgi:hypothetical protein